jgi:uncharacterized protein YegP (UPF0339 family)
MMSVVSDDDFFLEDEPLEAIEAAFAAGRKVITGRPTPATEGPTPSTATFELMRTSKGEFRFVLRAGTGEILATSENYATKEAALRGIDSIKATAAPAAVEQVTA